MYGPKKSKKQIEAQARASGGQFAIISENNVNGMGQGYSNIVIRNYDIELQQDKTFNPKNRFGEMILQIGNKGDVPKQIDKDTGKPVDLKEVLTPANYELLMIKAQLALSTKELNDRESAGSRGKSNNSDYSNYTSQSKYNNKQRSNSRETSQNKKS